MLQERFAEKERLIYANAFEWRFEFPEVLDEAGDFIGFDEVIGNPPYIRQEAIKEQKPAFMEMFGDFYCGTADIYTYFYKTGLALLKQGGLLCYIAPNKFMRAGYGRNTRELLTTQATPLQVLDFGDLPVFDEATTYPSIVMVEKKAPPPWPSPAGGGSSSNKPRRLSPPPSVGSTYHSPPHSGGRSGGGKSETTEKKLFIPVPVPTPLLEVARALRSTMTDAEKLLWQCLRGKQLGGYRFRRQNPIERFVLDFYCCEAKLAVELDGEQHNEADARIRDNERTSLLEEHGIRVIRFWNSEVLANLEGVLETVYKELQQRTTTSSPLPTSPRWGEEEKGDDASSLPRRVNKQPFSIPQRGRVGEGEKFLAATFNDPEQLKRLDKVLTSISFTMPVAALTPDGWTLERPDVLALMEKLRKAGKPLGEYVNGKFYYGIKTGLNEAFVIDEATRKQLIAEDPKSAELIKPWLRGRDIRKWKAEWAGLYLITIASSANREWPWSKEKAEAKARPMFERAFPAIHRHLSQWEEKLRKRDDQGKFWWELRSCAYFDDFKSDKIIYPDIAQRPKFTWDESEAFLGNTAYIIPTTETWLVGLLNSKVIWWLYLNKSSIIQGGFVRFIAQYMEQLPIPVATGTQKPPIIERVQKILANPDSPDVPRLEAEIDRLVYDLYGLTEEEIALVGGREAVSRSNRIPTLQAPVTELAGRITGIVAEGKSLSLQIMRKSIIAITMGDPTGIGPEIIVRALADPEIGEICRPLVLGDQGAMERAIAVTGESLEVRTVNTVPEEEPAGTGVIHLLPLSNLSTADMKYGKPGIAAGEAMYNYITGAARLCLAGEAAAMVTGPISKETLNRAGHHYPGHTELLAELTGTKEFVMMLAGERLKVTLVTIHEALRDVPQLLTYDKVLATIRITQHDLHRYFSRNPRLAVLALNPHCGEGGLFGDEEERIIAPAIAAARSEGIDAVGPLSADTLFHFASQGVYDAVVCMYHDQGLIPLKLLHFDDGVNITLGLPIIRTSVDHGTAYDLAGTGRASSRSMIAAIRMAAEMAGKKV